MKAYTTTFFYLPRNKWETVELPSDLVITPTRNTYENHEIVLAHSETEKKWYSLLMFDSPETEIIYTVVSSGNWVDCSGDFMPLDHTDAPFTWGETFFSSLSPRVRYVPIWETLPTGKYDFFGVEKLVESYKIIILCNSVLNPLTYTEKNIYNRFHIENYGENLQELVKNLEIYTEKKF